MREIAEFRIPEEFARRFLKKSEGTVLGDNFVRRLKVDTRSTRFHEIGEIESRYREKDDAFFTGWIIRREYSHQEIAAASLFSARITSIFEPAGEEKGTIYDESLACPVCRAGAVQLSALYLPEKRIPCRKDISQTIAGEVVVSKRLKDLLLLQEITGIKLGAIQSGPPTFRESGNWFQLIPAAPPRAEVAPPTLAGENPFDLDERCEYRCPRGDLIGLNLLSEVSIAAASRGDTDIVFTRQFVGVRRGLLRPERIMLVSPKVRRLFEDEKVKGVALEIAHLV